MLATAAGEGRAVRGTMSWPRIQPPCVSSRLLASQQRGARPSGEGARRLVPVCHSVGSQAKPDRLRARLSAAGPSPRFWVDSLGHEAGLQLGVRGLGVHVTHRRRRSAGPISKRNDREGGSRPPSAALAVPSRDRGVSAVQMPGLPSRRQLNGSHKRSRSVVSPRLGPGFRPARRAAGL